jgi:hypothetical protein
MNCGKKAPKNSNVLGLLRAIRHPCALRHEAAARDLRRGAVDRLAAGADHLPAEPDQVGSASEPQPVKPVAHRLDQRRQPDAGSRDDDGLAHLRAEHIEDSGARAVAQAVGDDQGHGGARHDDDDQAGDEISGVEFEGRLPIVFASAGRGNCTPHLLRGRAA